jgi:hypothetical protein
MAQMGKLIDEATRSGELIATGGLLPISKGGVRVKASGGKVTVVDGPFPEAKEVVGGFAILQYDSREAAIDGAKRFMKIAGDGVSEVYPIMEDGALPQ